MSELNEENRQFLREVLAECDKAQAKITEAMRPHQEALAYVQGVRDLTLEKFGAEVVDTCGGCGTLILVGDKGHVCMDGDPVFCEACSPTWGELLEDEKDNTERDDHAELMAAIQAHLDAGGSLDDKCVRTL